MRGEERGGHIPGAKSIPFFWTQYMDWVEVLVEKNLNPDDSIIVYGYDEQESEQMVEKLLELGYHDVNVYNGFVKNWANISVNDGGWFEWISDSANPIEKREA